MFLWAFNPVSFGVVSWMWCCCKQRKDSRAPRVVLGKNALNISQVYTVNFYLLLLFYTTVVSIASNLTFSDFILNQVFRNDKIMLKAMIILIFIQFCNLVCVQCFETVDGSASVEREDFTDYNEMLEHLFKCRTFYPCFEFMNSQTPFCFKPLLVIGHLFIMIWDSNMSIGKCIFL